MSIHSKHTQSNVHPVSDAETRAARHWLDAVIHRTRESDLGYLVDLQKGTLCCLRRGLEPDVSAAIARRLPLPVRGMWFEGWSPAEEPLHYRTVGEFVECVKGFVPAHGADAVIEEDALAAAQTFFTQWPELADMARPFLPRDLFERSEPVNRASSV